MLSSISPSGIHKSTSPQRRTHRQQGLGMTNPLGLRHLTHVLEQGPTLEPHGHIAMQEAQQHRPAQPGYHQLGYPQPPHHMMQMLHEQSAQNIQYQIKSYYNSYPQYAIPMDDAYIPQTPAPTFLPTPPSTNVSTRLAAPMYYSTPQDTLEHFYAQQYSNMYANASPCPSPVHTAYPVQHCAPSSPTRVEQQIDSPMIEAMSPREAMLAHMNVDASIEDTGISAQEVQSYMSEQDSTDQKWTCLFEGCGKRFGRKENIRSHVQTHLGDRQFKCNACHKCFVRQHDLKRHAKIHSGQKPYVCPCGNGFARQDALTRHRQRGVCEGALPGFEKREVKRGRPKKIRPEDGQDSSIESAGSSPFPNDGALDADSHLEAFIKAYNDTPPASPARISPDLPELSTGMFSDSTFDWGAVEPQPSLCTDAFSPAAISSSPVGDFDDDDSFLKGAFTGTKTIDNNDCSGLLNFESDGQFDGHVMTPGEQFPSHLEAWLQPA